MYNRHFSVVNCSFSSFFPIKIKRICSYNSAWPSFYIRIITKKKKRNRCTFTIRSTLLILVGKLKSFVRKFYGSHNDLVSLFRTTLFHTWFSGIRVSQYLVFYALICISLFVLFLFIIVLCVLLNIVSFLVLCVLLSIVCPS